MLGLIMSSMTLTSPYNQHSTVIGKMTAHIFCPGSPGVRQLNAGLATYHGVRAPHPRRYLEELSLAGIDDAK